ncbi:MAG: peptidase MA family metallohydrolase [Tepidanaerobacteraceae bacterium]|nr:peptidase MA family metallohydrolase [Tepidanaerobacteraceae bacterium]
MRRRIVLLAMAVLLLLSAAGVYYYKELTIFGFKLKGFEVMNTPHFEILFLPEDQNEVEAVSKAAERAYVEVGRDLGFFPKDRIPIIIFPDSRSLQQAFHWPADESNQGVYYRGIIYVQAPGAWIDDAPNIEEIFYIKGPMVHEYTHLAVDRLTGGNYSRWFTEGVAQYEEERITGYTLARDFDIDKKESYSIGDIISRFDDLPDVPKAYIAALNMTKIMAGKDGVGEIRKILSQLKDGASADEIFLQRAGKTPPEGNFHLVTNIINGGDCVE